MKNHDIIPRWCQFGPWFHGRNAWIFLLNLSSASFNLLRPCCVRWCHATFITSLHGVASNTWHNTSPLNKVCCQHTAGFFTLSLVRCCLTAKHYRAVRLGRLISHPQFDTLSPSCKSRTSLGTMGSGATELLGLLKGGSPFIWGHYNSTKACGCLHTERAEDEWAALTPLTCIDKSTGSAEGETYHVWSLWRKKSLNKMTKQPLNSSRSPNRFLLSPFLKIIIS